MSHEYTITLADNREIGITEYGDLHGTPVFYFHGTPSSRLEAALIERSAISKNIRLIAIDRPGMGLSTHSASRTLLTWPDDVSHIADQLQLEKFGIIGLSGGAPYVAACAHTMPYRLLGAVIVSGMGPLSLPEASAALPRGHRMVNAAIKWIPGVARLMMWLTKSALQKPSLFDKMIQQLSPPDRDLFSEPSEKESMLSRALEAFRQGTTGAAFEMKLLLEPWGFNLHDIQTPVSVWHGEADIQAHLAHAMIYANYIPGATLHVMPDEGHVSVLVNHAEEILSDACVERRYGGLPTR